MKNIIKTVERSSPLRRRVKPGWELKSINGNAICDVLDYKFYSYDSVLELELVTPEGRLKRRRVKKAEGADLGLDFETYLMDRPRSCANKCIFCFIDQNPPGMRKSIYFKDDDARLSFLMGCYITLTNLSEREIQRITELKISPINVSVHATEPELRRRLLGSPRAGEAMNIMRRLAAAGICMNCQIVCCPGINDGEALDRTMEELASLYPAVNSVSVVPFGMTKHRQGLTEIEPFTAEHAAETVAQVQRFADACLERYGTRIFFCADELYIKAGMELPPDEYYEAHTQLENGVGMIRLLEREFRMALDTAPEPDGAEFSIACGTAAAPYLEKLLCTAAEKYDNINGKVYSIRNDFFGESVTVSGLICGCDLIAQLRDKKLGERLLISSNMLRDAEQDFLDGITLEQVSRELGLPVYPISEDGGELCDAVCGILPAPKTPRAAEETEYNPYNQVRK